MQCRKTLGSNVQKEWPHNSKTQPPIPLSVQVDVGRRHASHKQLSHKQQVKYIQIRLLQQMPTWSNTNTDNSFFRIYTFILTSHLHSTAAYFFRAIFCAVASVNTGNLGCSSSLSSIEVDTQLTIPLEKIKSIHLFNPVCIPPFCKKICSYKYNY